MSFKEYWKADIERHASNAEPEGSLVQYWQNGANDDSTPVTKPQLPPVVADGTTPDYNPFSTFLTWSQHGTNSSKRITSGARQSTSKGTESGPSLFQSAAMLGAASILMTRPPGFDQSFADLFQNGAFTLVENFARRIGIEADIEIPSVDAIQKEAEWVTNGYRSLIPPEAKLAGSTNKRAELIDKETLFLTDGLFQQSFALTGPPSAEEQNIALFLTLVSPRLGPEELQSKLYDLVYQGAQDHATNSVDARLGKLKKPTSEKYSSWSMLRPRKYFVADWLTSNFALTSDEKKEHENTFWAFGPTGIVIRRISTREDEAVIPYASIQSQRTPISGKSDSQATPMISNSPAYADKIRRSAGILGGLIADNLVSDVGGAIVFVSSGREGRDRAVLVRDSAAVIHIIGKLASVARDFHHTLQNMTKHAEEPNTASRPLIRPNIIKNLMPDPTVFEEQTVWVGGVRDIEAEARLLDQQHVAPAITRVKKFYYEMKAIHGSDKDAWPDAPKDLLDRYIKKASRERERAIRIMKERIKLLPAPNNGK